MKIIIVLLLMITLSFNSFAEELTKAEVEQLQKELEKKEGELLGLVGYIVLTSLAFGIVLAVNGAIGNLNNQPPIGD